MTETATPVEITVEGEQGSGHDAAHVEEERRHASARGDGRPGQGGGSLRRALAGRVTREAKARTYSAEYKQRIVREADAAVASGQPGAVGELLRREGLYSSHLVDWRRQRDAGELAGLTPQKRGRKPSRSAVNDEVARLQRANAKLEDKLRKAEIIIDVQKKVAALLGETLDTPTEEDFARGLPSRRRQ